VEKMSGTVKGEELTGGSWGGTKKSDDARKEHYGTKIGR